MTVPRRPGLIASLLESRATCIGIGGAALLHVGLVATRLGGWPCPILHALGIPCPGCGLGRACALFLEGDVSRAMKLHAFAPIAVAAIALFSSAALLPAKSRQTLSRFVNRLETRCPIGLVILCGVLVYWMLRFALDGPAFILLVTSPAS